MANKTSKLFAATSPKAARQRTFRIDVSHGDYYSPATAMFDTGAMRTIISTNLVDVLEIPPIDNAERIIQSMGVVAHSKQYKIDLILPDEMHFKNIVAYASNMTGWNVDVLIGMDVISEGTLMIDSDDTQTTVTFAINV